jgi:hypothetical protein
MAKTSLTALGREAGSRTAGQCSSQQLPRGIEHMRSSTGYALVERFFRGGLQVPGEDQDDDDQDDEHHPGP